MELMAYDLLFESATGCRIHPEDEEDLGPRPTSVPDGWTGTDGPALMPEQWPRGSVLGLPMFHVLTVRLPAAFRRRGPEFPGIAFFQGEALWAGQGSYVGPPDLPPGDDPFLAAVAAAVPHPMLERLTDSIGGEFALIWLTESELAGGPTPPPVDTRLPGCRFEGDDNGPNAWDAPLATAAVWWVERDDPQAGLAPISGGVGDYVEEHLISPDEEWLDELAGRTHLGGTAFPEQALPVGLTPYYLELQALTWVNFGTWGSAQLDLESGVFDWACD